jgi:hypothetical protein
MKKKQNKKGAIPIGTVILDICVWDFSGQEEVTRHIANQIARAVYITYGINNFSADVFNMTNENND